MIQKLGDKVCNVEMILFQFFLDLAHSDVPDVGNSIAKVMLRFQKGMNCNITSGNVSWKDGGSIIGLVFSVDLLQGHVVVKLGGDMDNFHWNLRHEFFILVDGLATGIHQHVLVAGFFRSAGEGTGLCWLFIVVMKQCHNSM